MDIQQARSLVINAPEFFEDPVFMAWLNNGKCKFTWHCKGNAVADEFSDVVVSVDPSLNGEGDSSDMPDYIWRQIIDVCRVHLGAHQGECNYLVRITNLDH